MKLSIINNNINFNHTNKNQSHLKGIEVYATPSDFKAETLYAIMQKTSVFAAVSIAKETNKLNEYEVFNSYDMHCIKRHYKTHAIQDQPERECQSYVLQRRTDEPDSPENNPEELAKGYQKAYMQLLTKSAYQNSI